MKTKNLKNLTLKKESIAQLGTEQKYQIKGGAAWATMFDNCISYADGSCVAV